jgi:hypothetical protein
VTLAIQTETDAGFESRIVRMKGVELDTPQLLPWTAIPGRVTSLTCIPGGRHFAVTEEGSLWTSAKGSWGATEPSDEPLYGVVATRNAAIVCGALGKRVYYDLKTGIKSRLIDGMMDNLYAIAGDNERGAIAVGQGARFSHWNGDRWTNVIMLENRADLLSIAFAPKAIWVCGRLGSVGWHDGSKWTLRRVGQGDNTFHQIAVLGEEQYLAAGSEGICHRVDRSYTFHGDEEAYDRVVTTGRTVVASGGMKLAILAEVSRRGHAARPGRASPVSTRRGRHRRPAPSWTKFALPSRHAEDPRGRGRARDRRVDRLLAAP